ncbi:DNA-binding response regulator [Marinobacterium nitratireducens]|uniref:DNA-binding response regulator n=1 Tax=Marinobacterium nitratireducens TaxID=518897 RepID=A0A917ZKZ9_9GAMM|nr:response regulator transcription factor [Marinobacterium nitratireducens]GGO85702.1 DNA-binding response regulator [Marinobacterium nitratireducens]
MNTHKPIYVVDDDAEIRSLLQSYLERNQFEVRTAEDGEQLLTALRGGDAAALVVLDVMLPGDDGFEVCRKLRTFSQVPVIMLTASSDEMDRIVGLEIGADDYLAKPFNPRELLARIRAILRRSDQRSEAAAPGAGRYQRFAGFELDAAQRQLVDPHGVPVTLSGAEYELLHLLVDHAGEVLSRERIAEATRGRGNLPMDRFIDVQVSRLRQRLGDDARSPQLIKTVRGQGYVLAAPVETGAAGRH